VTERSDARLHEVARAALAVGDVQSAVIFVLTPGSSDLELAAVIGVDGPALDGLVAAVRNPAHPIVRTLADDDPSFDVLPMNPGGPRLRSHLPLRVDDATIGVLALAHESPLHDAQRQALIALAAEAAVAV
jgi:GAF domain-containing protein